MSIRAYDLHLPERTDSAVIFASPHSGRHYSDAFLRDSVLSPLALRSSEDAFVDRLFSAAPAAGAPLLCAHLPRAWIDLNRATTELDPALIDGLPRGPHNPRVASGLGVVPRVVAGGRSIYRGKIGLDAARSRIRTVWRPYHDQLRKLIDAAHDQFGQAILIDCHSMPHEALDTSVSVGRRPNVVLGDRFGAAAATGLVSRLEEIFTDLGLTCVRNAPFAGAFTAQQYGRPGRGQHVVQVEIDRALYMDEATVTPHSGFDDFKALMDRAVERITDLGRARDKALAAE
ncbi:N-formylglutamate amidohydrolase [Maribius pontilimi]|uniref:N-formylglutamate amidohydrolase n=1 Tax=Palleronia pontilimi TaxID=1964209 RepID=A0A934IEY2_9RHOB|nr:N-formylglutamate amidohydrolase [Palleronia pontilimi]MBJ3761360.1 N-formylglutamate amidohydrolase [Palleronia pontilimi]